MKMDLLTKGSRPRPDEKPLSGIVRLSTEGDGGFCG